MKIFKSSARTLSSHHHDISKSSTPFSSSSPSCDYSRPQLPSTDIEQTMASATNMIKSWMSCNSDEHSDNGWIAELISTVHNLQAAMLNLISIDPASEMLVEGQHLLQAAMKRLQKEFFKFLKHNIEYLRPESLSNRLSRPQSGSLLVSSSEHLSISLSISDGSDESEISPVRDALESDEGRLSIQAMKDLKMIADCMIGSGYAKECISVYKIMRRSAVDEALYNLGIDRSRSCPIHKMNWEAIELKIRSWLSSVDFAVKTIFNSERILCYHVFSAASTHESCFAEVTRDAALALFAFPAALAGEKKLWKKSPERIFRFLDLYRAIATLYLDIESIFCFDSMSAVRSLVDSTLGSMEEAVRSMLTDFESGIRKVNSKAPMHGGGGGVHPLVRYVMNFLGFLSDYSSSISEILAKSMPSHHHASLPENYIENATDSVTVRFAWLILVLLCQIDSKSKQFREIAHSYLFLANNVHYVVGKVRSEANLWRLVGKTWLMMHEEKVRQYAAKYERVRWSKVISAFSVYDLRAEMISMKDMRECFDRFNAAFEEARVGEEGWVVVDGKLREGIAAAVAGKVLPVYWKMYLRWRGVLARAGEVEDIAGVVRFTPEDLENYFTSSLLAGGSSRFSRLGSVAASSPPSSGESSLLH
ncbi:Exocyst complex component EXO70H1-like protein [Drosera capensis]